MLQQEQHRKRQIFIDIPVAADYVVKYTTETEHIDRERKAARLDQWA